MNQNATTAFIRFKQKLIRAWVLDTEDACLNKDRKATRIAHEEANEAERAFRTWLEPEIVSQKID